MTVLFVLLMFSVFITIDYLRKPHKGTVRYSVPGYENLGAVAADGGKKK
jgi:hypothetical protein